MRDASLAIQRAVYATLLGATDAGASVFDAVPGEPDKVGPFPRITFGDALSVPWSADCVSGSVTVFDVHVWSREVGFPEAKRIGGQVVALLDEVEIDIEGFRLIECRVDDVRYLRDPDGLTSRGVIALRIEVED